MCLKGHKEHVFKLSDWIIVKLRRFSNDLQNKVVTAEKVLIKVNAKILN